MSVNSWAHMFGEKPYNPRLSAVQNTFVAIITYGEGKRAGVAAVARLTHSHAHSLTHRVAQLPPRLPQRLSLLGPLVPVEPDALVHCRVLGAWSSLEPQDTQGPRGSRGPFALRAGVACACVCVRVFGVLATSSSCFLYSLPCFCDMKLVVVEEGSGSCV
jgi:hypothetical protein